MMWLVVSSVGMDLWRWLWGERGKERNEHLPGKGKTTQWAARLLWGCLSSCINVLLTHNIGKTISCYQMRYGKKTLTKDTVDLAK